jgi:hypothetical protein
MSRYHGGLFGREAFGVVKIGDSGAGVAKSAILPRPNGRGAVEAVLKMKQKWPHQRPFASCLPERLRKNRYLQKIEGSAEKCHLTKFVK